jgi:hypothetical protein
LADEPRPGTCPLCRSRKAKRACPAKGESICAVCCGTKRRVEIDCPEDCAYLTGGHAGAWDGRETERRRDSRRVLLHAQGLTDGQGRLLFLTLIGLLGIRGRRAELDDALALSAASALRKTIETHAKGLLYEHQAEDARAQALVHELQELFQAKDEAGVTISPPDADVLAALAALEAGLSASLKEDGGSAFLESAARIVGRVQGAPAISTKKPLIVEP